MPELFVYLAGVMSSVSVVMLAVLLMRLARPSPDTRIETIERMLERQERMIRDEISRIREESLLSARQGREESSISVTALGDSLLKRMCEIAGLQ